MNTELSPVQGEGSGERAVAPVAPEDRLIGRRSRPERQRTPPEIRRIFRRLDHLTKAVRRERKERGVGYQRATTSAQVDLYRALIEAEALVRAYKVGVFRQPQPGKITPK